MGAKCGSSSKTRAAASNKASKPKDPNANNNNSFIHEIPYSEQEKEEANFDPRNSRLRLNHSMHKSSIIVVNEKTKEIKPVDMQVDVTFRFEDIVTITKENINVIYKVEPQIIGISRYFNTLKVFLPSARQLRPAAKSHHDALLQENLRSEVHPSQEKVQDRLLSVENGVRNHEGVGPSQHREVLRSVSRR